MGERTIREDVEGRGLDVGKFYEFYDALVTTVEIPGFIDFVGGHYYPNIMYFQHAGVIVERVVSKEGLEMFNKRMINEIIGINGDVIEDGFDEPGVSEFGPLPVFDKKDIASLLGYEED